MIGDVLSVGDGHQGWQTKLSIKKDLELPNCPKTGAMTFKTVLDKGYGLLPPVTFQMRILNEKPGDDEKEGYWDGTSHVIPIYAQYSFDGEGRVVPGMLNTGRGGRPSHYHDYLKEQRHVDLANLVLTEMQALHENAAAHNIKL